jgi:hypothetical protein
VSDSHPERGEGAGPARQGRRASSLSARLLVPLALAASAALGLVWLLLPGLPPPDRPRTAPPDPRLAYAGPFRNVHPSVRYVPDARCADCHPKIEAAYAEHPMGRSLYPAARAPFPPTAPEQNNPFEAFGASFLVERQGGRTFQQRTRLAPGGKGPGPQQRWEVHYVLGSGTRGFSYLTDHDGYLFQTPISWYSQKQKWDLSPGMVRSLLTGRAILPDCLFCHANRADHVEGSVNHYRQPVFEGHAIGCQRCHGPGELHAGGGAGKGPDGIDPTIVNPRHLAPELRQAVCEQCHLQGAARTPARGRGAHDFRPGLPLESCWAVFVRAAEAGERPRAIGQVEQMYESRCFEGSAGPGRLGCTSCHDPHRRVEPAQRVAHYRGKCLSCHQQKGCSLPEPERLRQSATDSCIDCHMPRYGAADIPHTAATDHRILRGGKAAPRKDNRPSPGDRHPLVSFYRGRKGVDPDEDERCRAVALLPLALIGDPAAVRAVGEAQPALDDAVRRDPDDWPAGEARGYALTLRNRPAEALAAFEAILARAPDRELARVGAAIAADALGKAEAARGHWRRAVAANPWALGHRHSLTLSLIKAEAWAEALPHSEAWVRLDPLSADARAARVACLLATGNKAEARAEFARIEALAPPNLPELRIRFKRKLR